jgi:hypothetical protein
MLDRCTHGERRAWLAQAGDRGGAGGVRRARAHLRPERGGAGGVPPAVGGDGAAGHRPSMRRRLRASRPRAARAHHQRRLM